MVEGLFSFIANVTANCLALFVVAGILLGTSYMVAFSRAWLVWGPTHKERLEAKDALLNDKERLLGHTREELAYFRNKAFDLAGLADLATAETLNE